MDFARRTDDARHGCGTDAPTDEGVHDSGRAGADRSGPAELSAEPDPDSDQFAGAVFDQRAAAGGGGHDFAGGDAMVPGPHGGLYPAAADRFSSIPRIEAARR